jgi:FkbM family methyltransferase
MNLKAFARFIYANVPGVATARFAVKDLTAPYFRKPEFAGVQHLPIDYGLILDIGANRGQSIAAFRKLAPHSHIIGFEPEPASLQRLSARYRADPTVTIHGYGLASKPGQSTFFVPSYGRWNCDGMPASSREAATEWLKNPGRMYRFNEAKLTVTEFPVEFRTLDSFELAPRLIKLHAQGAELDILKGSLRTLEQHRPVLMCAFPGPALTEFAASFGYRPHVYEKGRFTVGVAPQPVTFTWYLTGDQTR